MAILLLPLTMHVAYAQNVGIGTASPTSLLSVEGLENTANGQNAAIKLRNQNSTNAWYLRAGATGTATPAGGFSIGDNSAYRMVIRDNGYVGINTTNPQWTLDVEGGFRFNGRLFVNGTSGLNGQVLTSRFLGIPTWSDPGLSQVASMVSFSTTSYNLSSATGDGNLIMFDQEIFDDGNRYNPALGRYTAPATGLYQITVSIDWQDLLTSTEFMFFTVLKNGTDRINGYTDRGGIPTVNFTLYAKLNAGDYISLYGGHTSTTTNRRLRKQDSFMTIVRLY